MIAQLMSMFVKIAVYRNWWISLFFSITYLTEGSRNILSQKEIVSKQVKKICHCSCCYAMPLPPGDEGMHRITHSSFGKQYRITHGSVGKMCKIALRWH